MASFLFSSSITLILLSIILPFSTAFDLVDIDGDLIENGKTYYIIPITTKSGLTYTQKTKECPLFITPEKTENSPGTPVQISSPLRTRFIKLDQHVSLAFKGPTLCGESLVWRQTIDPWARKLYITTGDDEPSLSGLFSFTKTDRSLLPMYDLIYWPSKDKDAVGSNVGLYEDDGLLGLTEYPTRVSFKKAFSVLELSTSN